jgi:anaerobic magnesium-protoporphyrin IX monomethyl ester cyclase
MAESTAGRRRRIVFIQTIPFPLIGIESLAAVLAQHELQVIITYVDSYATILRKLREFRPDFICFTCTTSDHGHLLSLAGKLKEIFHVPFIWGGPHPTFFPDIIKEQGVDIAVRGEAEHILPALIDDPSDLTRASCSFKKDDGIVVINPTGHLIHDLDALPYPDRGLYRKFYKHLPYSALMVVAGRGCPFNCSFCYNRTLKRIFSEDLRAGKYVRLRSVAHVIGELEDFIQRFGRPRYIKFMDDTFIFNRKWTLAFLDAYRTRVDIPFTCLGRADLMDEKIAEAMQCAGASCFMWAVETGNEKLRREVLKKNITDAQVRECGALLNKYHIPFRTYNMMGLPGETVDDALATVIINREIKNRFPLCTIYDPYPETELAEIAAAQGLLNQPITSDTFGKIQYVSSLLKVDPRILRIQMLFFYFVRFPFLDKYLRQWIAKDHPRLNRLLFFLAYGYVFWRTYKHTIPEMIQIVFRTFRPLSKLEVSSTGNQSSRVTSDVNSRHE